MRTKRKGIRVPAFEKNRAPSIQSGTGRVYLTDFGGEGAALAGQTMLLGDAPPPGWLCVSSQRF